MFVRKRKTAPTKRPASIGSLRKGTQRIVTLCVVSVSLCAASPLLSTSSSVYAQPAGKKKPDYKAAKKHYQNGERAVVAKKWKKAAKEFSIAYDITQDPVLFFKIANAYQMSGDCPSAITYFERYNAEAKPSEEYQRDTKKRINNCETKIAIANSWSTQDNSDTPSPMDPMDDQGAGTSTAMDYAEQPAFVDEEVTWQKTAAWTSIGVSAAFLTAGAVLGLSAQSREEDLNTLIRFRNSADQPTSYDQTVSDRYKSLADEGDTLNTMSMVAFGVAGASAATAIVFFLLDDSPDESAGHTLISPTIGKGSYGVNAGWEF